MTYLFFLNAILLPQVAKLAWQHDKPSTIILTAFLVVANTIFFAMGAGGRRNSNRD